jgi:outer membrane protein insertion porin family
MPQSLSRFLLAAALVCACAPVYAAQDGTVKRFAMQTITFRGTQRFTKPQLLAALGMKEGDTYSQQELQDSANKLSNSGMFAQVSYRFSATWAHYDLIDNPKLLPMQLENFVWMSQDELVAALKQRNPFFTGEIPEDGTLADDIAHQIEAVLADKGVKSPKVQGMPFTPIDGASSSTTYSYSVLEPRVEVGAIHFSGATPDLGPKLDAAVKKSVGGEYARPLMSGIEQVSLTPILQENGHLRAQFGEAEVKLMSAPADAVAKVEVTVPVTPGPQYRIAALKMAGDDPIAKDAAKKLASFKTGDVANMRAFRSEISKLGGAYLAKGYMGAKVKAEPTFDEAAHTVSFDIQIVPGDVYKLAKVDVQGVDLGQQNKFEGVWKLNPGAVYDPTYATMFLTRNQQKLGFINGYSLAWTQKLNDDSKTVELTLFFRKPGASRAQ